MANSRIKPMSSTYAMAFVLRGLCSGRYSLQNIALQTGISQVKLETYFQDHKTIPAEVADRICLAVYGPLANIRWEYYKNINIEPDPEYIRLKRQTQMMCEHFKTMPRHARMVKENARACEIMQSYIDAGITTLEDFRNVVLAVYPNAGIGPLSNYWLMFDCDYILSFDIEHALEVVLAGRKHKSA